MNITEAKKIPIKLLVEALGGRYSHTDRNGKLWYFSIFRPEEKTASMKIDLDKNQWHDFGLSTTFAHNHQGSGGDGVDLWCDYNFKDRRLGISEALAGLKTMKIVANDTPTQTAQTRAHLIPTIVTPRFKILKISENITFPSLKEELIRRRISKELAEVHLKQGWIEDTEKKKKYNAFLFENDKGGYEVSIPNPQKQTSFKTCIGPKASSRILTHLKTNSADVFEGFWDFLSWLQYNDLLLPRNHTYVLNSTSLVNETCTRIIHFKDEIKSAVLFMDNDEAGYQATHAIAQILSEENIRVGSFEQFYKGYKDLNEFWASRPKII